MKERIVSARFCDDIRHEVGNKYSLIGCYGNELYIEKLPAVMPKFCAHVQAMTPLDRPFKELKFRALLDDEIVAELEVPQSALKSANFAAENISAIAKRITISAIMVFSPLTINNGSTLRIEADTDDGTVIGNGIRVEQKDDPFGLKIPQQ